MMYTKFRAWKALSGLYKFYVGDFNQLPLKPYFTIFLLLQDGAIFQRFR